MLRILRTPVGVAAALVMAAMVVGPHVADACAGLIGSNGAVNLGRTTTLAAYHDGVEHYVTAFEFQGGGGEFGTLIPLPGVPIERRARRRLDAAAPRCARRSRRPRRFATPRRRAGGRRRVEVLQQMRIDALDITVLKGGGPDVAHVGAGRTASGSRRTRRKCSTSTRSAARSSSPPSSTATPRAARGQQRRRRHARPPHDPDDEPVGAAAHPRPRQAAGRPRRRRRLPADRRRAGAAARPTRDGLALTYNEPATKSPARRPARRRRHGLGADSPPGSPSSHRQQPASRPALRPRGRRERRAALRRRSPAGARRCRLAEAPIVAESRRGSLAAGAWHAGGRSCLVVAARSLRGADARSASTRAPRARRGIARRCSSPS